MVKIEKRIKGVAVCQPGSASANTGDNFVADADRRLTITGCPTPPTESLIWQKRPVFPGGNPGYTYLVKSPEGEFAVFVGHVPDGWPNAGAPFEVWINGGEAPRGLSELARSLSIDMRSQDRGWLRRKLEALLKTPGEPFELDLPDGRRILARSAVAAFAHLVLYRCEELGAFTDANLASTPVLDALMCKREPKTSGDWALAPYRDIANPATGDTFLLMLKEADLEDGRHRPYSVWFSGDYPASLDGLAKSLSLDMQVFETEWIARKLQQLSDVSEKHGGFWAPVPGNKEGKQQSYPSTVAYICALIQQRFMQLGWLTPEGVPVNHSGVVQLDEVRTAKQKQATHTSGKNCGKCSSIGTVVRMDGCDTCQACGDSKCG